MASEEGLRAGEPGELEELRDAQARQRQLFHEMARRLKAATVVVQAARNLVEIGSIGGMGALQDALEEFDR